MYATQRKNRRKSSPIVSMGYLTREQRKAMEYYESMRKKEKEEQKKAL